MSRAIAASHDPSLSGLLRRVIYYSLFAMILVMPFWVAFGRAFFGAGGWGVFFTLPLAVLVVFPYHIIIAVLAFVGNKVKLSKFSITILVCYYFFALLAQLSFVDGGDTQESVGSAFTLAGMPDALNSTIFVISFGASTIAAVAIAVSLIKEVIDRRRKKSVATAPAETTTNAAAK